MIEQRRAQFLSLLEIDQYVPRRLLQVAPDPILLEPIELVEPEGLSEHSLAEDRPTVEENAVGKSLESDRQGEKIAPSREGIQQNSSVQDVDSSQDIYDSQEKAAVSGSIASILDQPVKETNQSANLDDVEALSVDLSQKSNQQSNTEALTFVLTVWRIHDQLMVIDSRQPGTAYPTDRLLQNILRAMGHPLAQLPPSETVRWPIFTKQNGKGQSVQEETEQALAMVQAYISAQLSKQSVKAIVCMGEEAALFGLNMSDNESTEKVHIDTIGDLPVAITPSLHDMLQDPMLKAKAWKALQVLI